MVADNKNFPLLISYPQNLYPILRLLGDPQNQYPVIHIAGTNGKGSTAAMLHSILQTAGFKSGLYTSPHLVSFNERIRINEEYISDSDLKICFSKVDAAIKDAGYLELDYFGRITLAAFYYFALKKIDVLVCEVGLGGRLDATNVVENKLVSIITSIDLDHTDILGKDLENIAFEKAGIFKDKVPVIANTIYLNAKRVLERQSIALSCPVFFYGEAFFAKSIAVDWQAGTQTFSYCDIAGDCQNITLSMLGEHQIVNASLALAAIGIISSKICNKKYIINQDVIFKGLQKAYWPGRFDIRNIRHNNRNIKFIIDGAHNVAGIKILTKTLRASPYAKNGLVFVINILEDKDYMEICKNLSGLAKKVVILKIANPRALQPQILRNECQKYLPAELIYIANNFTEIFNFLDPEENIVCVTGSLYLVADILHAIS